MSATDDSSKVRYMAAYDDPDADDGTILVRYTTDKPDEVENRINLETGETRECERLAYISLGGWTTVEEARERSDELLDEVNNGGDA